MKIEVTPEMRERAVAFALALHYAINQQTEEMAEFFRVAAERHRLEAGRMLLRALDGDEEVQKAIKEKTNTNKALELIRTAYREQVQLSVACVTERDDD